MSLGKKNISGIVQAAGLFAHRTKFASIRGTFATDNPIATTRPMKNQVKLMDIRHGRDVPRRVHSLKKLGRVRSRLGCGAFLSRSGYYVEIKEQRQSVQTFKTKNWRNLRSSSIFLDLTRFHFSVEMVFAPDLYNLSGSASCRNPNHNFYRDRGVPPQFISPIANGYYWSTCWLKE